MSELETLIQNRNRLGAEMVVVMFQIVAILLVPVAFVLYAGGVLNDVYNIGKISVFCATISAVSLSWISIWKIYTKIDKQMQQFDFQILELKKNTGYDPNVNFKKQKEFDDQETKIGNNL